MFHKKVKSSDEIGGLEFRNKGQGIITSQPRPQLESFCRAKCKKDNFSKFLYSVYLLKLVRCEVIKTFAIWGCTGFFATLERTTQPY